MKRFEINNIYLDGLVEKTSKSLIKEMQNNILSHYETSLNITLLNSLLLNDKLSSDLSFQLSFWTFIYFLGKDDAPKKYTNEQYLSYLFANKQIYDQYIGRNRVLDLADEIIKLNDENLARSYFEKLDIIPVMMRDRYFLFKYGHYLSNEQKKAYLFHPELNLKEIDLIDSIILFDIEIPDNDLFSLISKKLCISPYSYNDMDDIDIYRYTSYLIKTKNDTYFDQFIKYISQTNTNLFYLELFCIEQLPFISDNMLSSLKNNCPVNLVFEDNFKYNDLFNLSTDLILHLESMDARSMENRLLVAYFFMAHKSNHKIPHPLEFEIARLYLKNDIDFLCDGLISHESVILALCYEIDELCNDNKAIDDHLLLLLNSSWHGLKDVLIPAYIEMLNDENIYDIREKLFTIILTKSNMNHYLLKRQSCHLLNIAFNWDFLDESHHINDVLLN